MKYDLSKIQSSKTRQILRDAMGVERDLGDRGDAQMARVVGRLIRSRILSNSTNSQLAADLRDAIMALRIEGK